MIMKFLAIIIPFILVSISSSLPIAQESAQSGVSTNEDQYHLAGNYAQVRFEYIMD